MIQNIAGYGSIDPSQKYYFPEKEDETNQDLMEVNQKREPLHSILRHHEDSSSKTTPEKKALSFSPSIGLESDDQQDVGDQDRHILRRLTYEEKIILYAKRPDLEMVNENQKYDEYEKSSGRKGSIMLALIITLSLILLIILVYLTVGSETDLSD